MRIATVIRGPSTPLGTFGSWWSATGFRSASVERPSEGAYPRCPKGIYVCELRFSYARRNNDYGFGKGMIYEVLDVPGRTLIQIHVANWAAQLRGCIAPGARVADIKTFSGEMRRGVTSSTAALKALMADMNGERFLLEIREDNSAEKNLVH